MEQRPKVSHTLGIPDGEQQLKIFQVIELSPGQRLAKPPWRAYIQLIADNDQRALDAGIFLTRIPILRHGSQVITMESWAATNGFDILTTANALCDLEDEGLIAWDDH